MSLQEKYIEAIIKTEEYFRPFDKRLIEYAAIVFLYIFNMKYKNMTVGVAQISFRYWLERYQFGFWRTLIKTMSKKCNREMVAYYAINKQISIFNERDFLIAYNGRPSKIYVEIFRYQILRFSKADLIQKHTGLEVRNDTPNPSRIYQNEYAEGVQKA